MTVTVQVLFGRPQREIASLLRDRLSRCWIGLDTQRRLISLRWPAV